MSGNSVKNVILTILPILRWNISDFGIIKYCYLLWESWLSLTISTMYGGWSDVNCWSCHHHSWGSTIQSSGPQSLLSKLAAQHLHKQRDQKSLWMRYIIHTTFQKIKLTSQKVISGRHFDVNVNVSLAVMSSEDGVG